MSGTRDAPRRWRRFTPAQRLARFAVYLAVAVAVVTSLRSVEVIPEFLLDAPEQVQDLLRRMWPIAWDYYPRGVHDALVETLHIATLGTLLAVAMALPVGVAAAPNVVRSRAVNGLARLLLVSSRSVNSLVWALLFVAVFGRFIGFATYQLDSNLRNSTMVGIVGAGGIGGTLFSAFQRFDYDFVAAILLSIIAMIMVGELLARWVRRVFVDSGRVDEE